MRLEHCGRYLFARDFLLSQGAETVFDAGCADGYGAQILKDAGIRVLGGDKNPTAGRAGLSIIDFDREEWTDQFTNIDAVVCFETIEHVHDPEKLMADIGKLLDPKGILILSVPNDRFEDGKNPYHINIFSDNDIQYLMVENGFRIEEIYGQSLCNLLCMNEMEEIQKCHLGERGISKSFLDDRESIIDLSYMFAYPKAVCTNESYSKIYVNSLGMTESMYPPHTAQSH